MGLCLLSLFFYPQRLCVLSLPVGSQHHVDKALNLIGKKFKELNLTNIYAPPLPSLALPSLPMTSWVSMLYRISVPDPFPKPIPVERLLACRPSRPMGVCALRSGLHLVQPVCSLRPGLLDPTLGGLYFPAPGHAFSFLGF